ncbi:MAG: class F sortase [Marmoricola sp.]
MGSHVKARGDRRRHAGARSKRERTLGQTLLGGGAATLLIAFAAGWWSWSEPAPDRTAPTGAIISTSPSPNPPVESPPVVSPPVVSPPVVSPVVPASRAPSVVSPERPLSAQLPSGTVVPVVPVSSNAKGELDVPSDIRTAGWWRGGSRLGDPFGSILLAAHVDSADQGLGPYAELLTVRPGKHIVLTSATLRQTFAVRSLTLIPQGSLARHKSVYAATGSRRLTLVTCAPPYRRSRGGYQRLAIVTAVPISEPTPKAG